MSAYLCGLRPTGEPLRRSDLFGPVARLGGAEEPLRWIETGPFVAMSRDASAPRPLLARWRTLAGVGDVRLDNRAEVASWCPAAPDTASDLELVLAALDEMGEACVPRLLGDFAFAAWDPRAHKLLAARDAFGVKQLFYRAEDGLLLFSSRLAAFEAPGRYDPEYIADFLVTGGAARDRTIWLNAGSLPAGTLLVQRGTVRSTRRFWDPADYEPAPGGDLHALRDEFRALFRKAVALRAEPGATWAQLSGGMDSSSIVATVQSMAASGALSGGLSGTITLVDTLGSGDERLYSNAVVSRYGVRNELVTDYWPWQDAGAGAPRTDEPRPLYPFFERDRHTAARVRAGGGRVLLSGLGSDHFLYGNLGFFSDMAAHGHVLAALAEAARWAVTWRQSFWRVAGRHIAYPFLPRALKLRMANPWESLPRWLPQGYVRRYDVARRLPIMRKIAGRPGRNFARETADEVLRLPEMIDREPITDGIEMRYPFLYRPLAELCLRLPIQARVRPETRKWVLREAMRDVLPETVYRRVRKGSIDARILWAFDRERGRLDALLREPILAELGCVDAGALRGAVEAARRGSAPNLVFLVFALSLETWLSVRHGRWTARPAAAQPAA